MLDKLKIKKIEKAFFGGDPEKAYAMVSSMGEWDDFLAAFPERAEEMYNIMNKSDLTNYNKIPFVFDD